MPPSEWPACQLDAAQPPAPLQAAEPRQHVLVVVDMQKDYDTAANKELYGEAYKEGTKRARSRARAARTSRLSARAQRR